ncbi:MAG: hypothetical protein JW870_01855, partial [Candidatus Delongbacteria bacterium]|nr:hypothetical protein [Candidatus Delongbacteria bacterium]
LEYPVRINQIPIFEKNNSNISINVFSYSCSKKDKKPRYVSNNVDLDVLKIADETEKEDDETHHEYRQRLETIIFQRTGRRFKFGDDNYKKYSEIRREINKKIRSKMVPLYLSRNKGENTIEVNLLLLVKDDNEHFAWIRDLGSLLGSPSGGNNTVCFHCLNIFKNSQALSKHKERCSQVKHQKTSFPPPGSLLKFRDYKNMVTAPYIIVADFEAFLVDTIDNTAPTTSKIPDKSYFRYNEVQSGGNTKYLQEHVVCGYSYVVIDAYNNVVRHKVYHSEDRNENVMTTFFDDIIPYTNRLYNDMEARQEDAKNNIPRVRVGPGDICFFCDKVLTIEDEPVIHHDHFTYEFKGAACKTCNLQAPWTKFIPVIFHNLTSYDMHPIVQNLNHEKIENISVIPLSSDKFISISMNHIRCIDSLRFLNASLDKLASMLDKEKFVVTKRVFHKKYDQSVPNLEEHMDLLFRKGFFPYKSLRSVDDFLRTDIPSKEEFLSDLTETEISDADYEHVVKVWTEFHIQNLGEYLDLYNLLDTCLLSDVFLNFRHLFLEKFKLDPCKYVSLPSISWQSALKFSKVELEYISEPDMHLFLEAGMRGGYAGSGSIRHAKANNKYMKNYDKNEEDSFIMYWDCNALYATALSEPLPVHSFYWLDDDEKQIWNDTNYISNLSKNGMYGYFAECDLSIPPDKHKDLDDFPPIPVKRSVDNSELSCYQNYLQSELNINTNTAKTEKLILDLHSKKKYILHYTILQKYLELGVKIDKVHNVLRFVQRPWLKEFIKFVTEQRQKSQTTFEKDFWKLIVNSIFGKSIEQKRKRQTITVVTSKDANYCNWNVGNRCDNFTKKSNLDNIIVINKDVVLFVLRRTSVYLDTPIYTGVACLDISKTFMYHFFYFYLKRLYEERIKLVGTDTDSIIAYITGENGKELDVYQDMYDNKDLFDMSEYPRSGPFAKFHDPTNLKVLGKFKDETAKDGVINEIVFIKAKMYSFKTESGHEEKKAKGIPRHWVKRHQRFDDYMIALNNTETSIVEAKKIASLRHRIYTIQYKKMGINQYDNKRYLVNNQNSVSYGNNILHNVRKSTDCTSKKCKGECAQHL